MKHGGIGRSRNPAAAAQRARRQVRPRHTTTGRAAATTSVGEWRLATNERGDLVAVHEPTGTTTVLAQHPGGGE